MLLTCLWTRSKGREHGLTKQLSHHQQPAALTMRSASLGDTSLRGLTPLKTPLLLPLPLPPQPFKAPPPGWVHPLLPFTPGLQPSSPASPISCTHKKRWVVFSPRNCRWDTTIMLYHPFTLAMGPLCPGNTFKAESWSQGCQQGCPSPALTCNAEESAVSPVQWWPHTRGIPFLLHTISDSPPHHLIYIFFPAPCILSSSFPLAVLISRS